MAARCALRRAVWALLISSLPCYSADLLFLRSSQEPSTGQRQLEIASQFYGLNLRVLAGDDEAAVGKAIDQKATAAVAIAADALPRVDEQSMLRRLNRRPGGSVPLLILGLTPETDPAVLRAWSGGAVLACKRAVAAESLEYVVGRDTELAGPLADFSIPFSGTNPAYFVTADRGNNNLQQITELRGGGRVFPVFVRAGVGQVRVFLLSTFYPASELLVALNKGPMLSAFADIAPVMLFTKYSAGDRGWHTIHHYANFTIDDPWLREPYGFLTYKGLLAEMEKHNFHSTIAFIPWNYDRSEPQVVELIRSHPERFSICIHGDNHDHKEFTDYKSKPLATQIYDVKQSLARMQKFQSLTGISYDKVMVFPHSIAPEKTLEALKTDNFLATVNSSNVPMGEADPALIPFALRPVTLSFAKFASIRRYEVGAQISKSFIAMNAFLGNPIFLYCHHDFFANGIGAFDPVADEVNEIQPDTRWRSLGEIVRHLYLVKARQDSGYDVLAFSSDFLLENPGNQNSIFYVRREEGEHPAIRSVTIDGRSCPYRLEDGYLEFNVAIPATGRSHVRIAYANDLELNAVSISKHSIRDYFLRRASDFRDITLPQYAVGRALIRVYYEREMTPTALFACFGVLLVCLAGGAWWWRKTGRNSQLRKTSITAAH